MNWKVTLIAFLCIPTLVSGMSYADEGDGVSIFAAAVNNPQEAMDHLAPPPKIVDGVQTRARQGRHVAASAATGEFTYNPKTGVCENAKGEPGLNAVAIEQVRKTKNGECGDFKGISLNGDDLSDQKYEGWHLQGADLSGARLFFAKLLDADLRGVRVDKLDFSYATVTGRIDKFTKFPAGLACRVTGEKKQWLECFQ